jgi:hypothetical protein
VSRSQEVRPKAGRGPLVPRPSALRPHTAGIAGARFPSLRRVPFGAVLQDGAGDLLVAASEDAARDVRSLAAALPAPEELTPGTLVVLLADAIAQASITGRLLSALGRRRTLPRTLRCTALLARGYVDIGANTDPASGADLVWGRAPG